MQRQNATPVAIGLVFTFVGAGVAYAGGATGGPDLDVTYIERTPRYPRYCVEQVGGVPRLRPGTEHDKRWPEVGERVTYIAHIANKGDAPSCAFLSAWVIDGVTVGVRQTPGVAVATETTVPFDATWPLSAQTITIIVDPLNAIPEAIETNNRLSIGSHDLALSVWVERGLFDLFNAARNLSGSFSFEDWVQAQVAQMNERLSQAIYPVAPHGILDRVRIDRIAVADELDGLHSPLATDPLLAVSDGQLSLKDNDVGNRVGLGWIWQDYVHRFATAIDWNVLRGVARQLDAIDLSRMALSSDSSNNNGVQVRDRNGNIILASTLPPQATTERSGLMGGGDTSPYGDATYFESHTAGGMNAHAGKRRGYDGEYLFDVPARTTIRVVDEAGIPMPEAALALYQRTTTGIDDVPEIVGTTDAQGLLLLPNRPVTPITTGTGHVLRDNPFGPIDVTGANGLMLVRASRGDQDLYGWLSLLDVNMAYWAGERDSVIMPVTATDLTPVTTNPGRLQPVSLFDNALITPHLDPPRLGLGDRAGSNVQ